MIHYIISHITILHSLRTYIILETWQNRHQSSVFYLLIYNSLASYYHAIL